MLKTRHRSAASGRLRAAAGVGAALFVLATPLAAAAAPGTAGTPAGAGAARADAAKAGGAPAAQPVPRICTLQPAAHSASEWTSCLHVDARLDSLPGVGQTARLHIEVTAEHTEKAVTIQADLPANLAWAQAPTGLSRTAVASAAPETGGRLDRAGATVALTAGAPAQFDGVVRATAGGAAQVRVRALIDLGGGNVDAAEDSVFLTVGGTAAKAGIDAGNASTVTATGAANARPAIARPYKPAALAGRATGSGVTATSACVTGSWFYVDNNGATRPSRSFQVQAWDSDPIGDDLLATGVTDGSGHYHLCFDNDDGIGGAGQDVYLKFVAENANWRVQTAGTPLTFSTSVVNDVLNGSDTNFGSLQPGDSSFMRGLHAFDEAQDAWNGVPGACWDLDDAVCRQVRISWAADSVDATRYTTGDNIVHLMAADPDAPIVVVHEISHALMDDVYEDAFPAAPNCNPHQIPASTSAGCAWTEGFAEWLPASIYNDPFFRWPNGASQSLEDPTWGTAGWANGDTVEGRVAGALIDISDAGNESFWDHFSEPAMGNIWTEFQTKKPVTFADFWAKRTADKSDAGALASIYQSTIDYGFREPLGAAALNRPTPTPHNFSFTTTTNYWSVVAMRGGAADYDLDLFDDRPQATKLDTSSFGAGIVDFVAVDSNRRALGDYYPRVRQFNGGTGNYLVQLASGNTTLPPATTQSISMGSGDIVAVRDTNLGIGQTATFTVTATGSGDAELFVMRSQAADPSTWVRARATALGTASAAGPGGTETVTVTAPEAGWYGLVIINRSGSGSYNVSRS